MKHNVSPAIVIIPLMASAIIVSSCIYDAPEGDGFYRTLWETSQEPFENLTIEFLCGGIISAQADNSAGSYGRYDAHDMTAYFTELHLIMDRGTIIFEEAHRSNDRMLISWHYTGSTISYSTALQRLSSYKQ